MHKVLLAVSIFLLLSNFNPASAKILFYDDCEDAPKSSDWKVNGNGHNGKSFSVSSEQAKAGKRSYKYVLPVLPAGADAHIGSIPLKPFRHYKYNTSHWIGFSIYIPSNFDFPSQGNNWVLGPQFHGSPDDIKECDDWRNPNFAMLADDSTNSFKVSILGQKAKCSLKSYSSAKTYDRSTKTSLPNNSLKKGAWNDVVFNFNFSYSSGGYFKIWLNGKQVVDNKGINSFNDDLSPFFYIGLYGIVDKKTTVYYDEFRVGDSKSSYAEVAPKGGGSSNLPVVTELEPPTLSIFSD